MKKILVAIILASLAISFMARAEPTDAEFDQAVQSAITRIKGDRDLLEVMIRLPVEDQLDFIVDVAFEELLAMEKLKNGEPYHGKEPSF